MCSVHILHQQKLLHVLTRGRNNPASVSRVGSLFASSYHVTATLLSPEDSGADHVAKWQSRAIKKPGAQHKSGGWKDRQKAAAPSKARKNETPTSQKQHQRGGYDSRVSVVSSELRKLRLEDVHEEREMLPRHPVPTSEIKAESHEIVFGVAPCLLALLQGRRKLSKLFVKDGEASHRASVLKVCEEAHLRGVHVLRVSKTFLDQMSSGRVHQGVCLQASPLSYLTESGDSTSSRKHDHTPLWLVLAGIQDPMNLGAILRSAYFLGVDRVASSLSHSCPLSPVVSKASSGAMEVIGVYGYENVADMLRVKVARGWQVVGTVAAEAEESHVHVTPCSDFKMTKPTLLLIGGEGEGLPKELLSLCQTHLTIPPGRELFLGMESLNVSVATGILLHSLLRSRRSTKSN